jgi:glucose/arabinose dehydrogenase/PKD repeat protein
MTLPSGFQSQVVFSGLVQPTNFAFASDGRVFVSEKRGVVKVFDGFDDPTPSVFADLSTNTLDYQDRGMLGLALAPNFPTDPYVYVLYSHDAPIGGTAPRWNDTCPTPPGPTQDGCLSSSRLSRLRASGNTMVGGEDVLIEDWCQQFPSHSIGTVTFGPDGALYAGGGEGASYNTTDYGQLGGTLTGSQNSVPRNPCGDPPGTVGSALSPPTAEGGALRAQDLVAASDPTTLDGSIIRVDPETGDPLADNPNIGASDTNARRIVAHGLRNPFRFTFRPGTTDLWLGDVGWDLWEEIDRHPDARSSVKNFGWPCYEGAAPQAGYQALGLSLCGALYGAPTATTAPVYKYQHGAKIVPNDPNDFCGTSGGSVSGLAFYNGGSLPGTVGTYPAQYDGALFFADYSRKCISVMLPGADGLPDPTKAQRFASNVGVAGSVALHAGPGGDIYWVDLAGGTINRIRYFPNNRPPVARIRSDATSGGVPLTVHFDGTESTDDDGDPLEYAWDLDGDGDYNDSTDPQPQATFNDTAQHTVRLRVTDVVGATGIAQVTINSGNHAPTVDIDAPTSATQWAVGNTINFSATGSDVDTPNLPDSAYDWAVILLHCPDVNACHEHPIETYHGMKSGSFIAPDHEYPARLRLDVTVTDPGGVSAVDSVEILPQTTTLTVDSNVSGATLAVDSVAQPGPFTTTVIRGSQHVVTAPLQRVGGIVYDFDKWSNNAPRAQSITVSSAVTLTATLSRRDVRAVDLATFEPAANTTRSVAIPVRLGKQASAPVTVEWATETGSAGASDFVPATGAIVFPAGSTEQFATVTINGNALPEGSETFGLRLSAPQNANLTRSLATVTIQDTPTPTANAGPDQEIESAAQATLDASASSDTGGLPLTYSWVQIDGPLAVFDNRNIAKPKISAPAGPERMTFRVTVTNSAGASTVDDVTVTVKAPK